jgi:hypothetical protein
VIVVIVPAVITVVLVVIVVIVVTRNSIWAVAVLVVVFVRHMLARPGKVARRRNDLAPPRPREPADRQNGHDTRRRGNDPKPTWPTIAGCALGLIRMPVGSVESPARAGALPLLGRAHKRILCR